MVTKLPFRPNYKESAELLFIKTTAFLLSTKSWFTLLAMTGRGYESTKSTAMSPLLESLPSWVPDYGSNTLVGARDTFDEDPPFDKTSKVTFTNNPRIIQIQAVAFDMVSHLSSSLKMITSSPLLPNPQAPLKTGQFRQFTVNAYAEMREWYLQAQQLARKYSSFSRKSQEAADQAFWELCLRGGGIHFSSPTISPTLYPPLSSSARKLFEFFLLTEPEEVLKYWGELVMEGKITETHDMNIFLMRKFWCTVMGKALSITAAGSIALGPPLAREGDTLAHVRGGYTPIVLRRKTPGERIAEWVGTCSVHGVEDAYSGSDWENWLLE